MSGSNTSGVVEPATKSCSSVARYCVESDDSTWTVTLMFGFAASKALIAFWVCWPSVPSPDSANTIVCLVLAEAGGLLELELLHAAAVRATTATDKAMAPDRLTRMLEPILGTPCVRYVTVGIWLGPRSYRTWRAVKVKVRVGALAGPRSVSRSGLIRCDDLGEFLLHVRESLLRRLVSFEGLVRLAGDHQTCLVVVGDRRAGLRLLDG